MALLLAACSVVGRCTQASSTPRRPLARQTSSRRSRSSRRSLWMTSRTSSAASRSLRRSVQLPPGLCVIYIVFMLCLYRFCVVFMQLHVDRSRRPVRIRIQLAAAVWAARHHSSLSSIGLTTRRRLLPPPRSRRHSQRAAAQQQQQQFRSRTYTSSPPGA